MENKNIKQSNKVKINRFLVASINIKNTSVRRKFYKKPKGLCMEYKLYLVNINSESNEFLKKILVEELSKGYSNFLKKFYCFSPNFKVISGQSC